MPIPLWRAESVPTIVNRAASWCVRIGMIGPGATGYCGCANRDFEMTGVKAYC